MYQNSRQGQSQHILKQHVVILVEVYTQHLQSWEEVTQVFGLHTRNLFHVECDACSPLSLLHHILSFTHHRARIHINGVTPGLQTTGERDGRPQSHGSTSLRHDQSMTPDGGALPPPRGA